MKNLFLLVIMAIALCLLPGCQKENGAIQPHQELSSQHTNLLDIDMEFNVEQFHNLMEANNARLAALGIGTSRECLESANVPADFSTIQEAVDMVCENGSINVKAGTYNEFIVISKKGITLKTKGDVLLNGAFVLDENADSTTINGFTINIVVPEGEMPAGIFALGADGLDISKNEVYGGSNGIFLWNMNGSKVKDNFVHDVSLGIAISSQSGYTSHYNKVTKNIVTRITHSTGIGLQGDCDYNTIQGNIVTECTSSSNAAIFVHGQVTGSCDSNVVRNNTCNFNAYGGIRTSGEVTNNSIGPNNTCNNNVRYGILIGSDAMDNQIMNNQALNNNPCDLFDFTDGMNVFTNNDYGCFSTEIVIPQ